MDIQSNQASLSEVQRFYRNSVLFLTGSTGFIGKLYLEKILRSLPVKKVYVLVRNKRDVPVEKRVEKIFESVIFDTIKRTNPEALKKVSTISGDLFLPNFGISNEDRETLVNEVNVIVHCAATTRFDAKLKNATFINVRGVRDMIALAKDIHDLKSFSVVGTAYSNCYKQEIEEKIYPSTISAEKLIHACENLDDDIIDYMTEKIIKGWPNTYSFTKQVAEDLIQRECQNLPVYIARPTIVVSTANEPLAAFVDNFYTLAGFVVLNALGICRINYYKNGILDIIPADLVVNQCIVAGWQAGQELKSHRRTEVPVYNMCSGRDNPVTQDDIYDYVESFGRKVPSMAQPLYPLYFRTTCKYNYLFWRFFFHTLLAYAFDLFAKMSGKPTRYVEGVQRMHKFHELYEHFTTREFFYHNQNTHKLLKKMTFQDKELFNFDITMVDWKSYFVNYPKGIRVYLMQDSLETLSAARLRFKKMKLYFFITVFILIALWYYLIKFTIIWAVPMVTGTMLYVIRSIICS